VLATFGVAPLDNPPEFIGVEGRPDGGEMVAVQLEVARVD
jgi:hypothetical protein